MYAKVIVDIVHEQLDKVFEYHIPSDLEGGLKVGMEVVAPFGNGNREISGYIVQISEICEFDPAKVKDILRPASKRNVIEENLIALAAWMKEHYGGTMIQALKTVLPVKKETVIREKRYVRLLLDEEAGREKLAEFLSDLRMKSRARVMAALLENQVLEQEFIIKKLNVSKSVIDALDKQGIVRIESEQVFRNKIINNRKATQCLN